MPCRIREHCEAVIYLDAAATGLHKPPGVAAAMVEAMATMGNSGRGAHHHAMAAARCVYNGRRVVGSFFGASAEQVAFTSGATEGLNMAIKGLLQKDDHVITTVLEHNAVLRPLHPYHTSVIPLAANGDLDYAAFPKALTPKTKAVVITTASNLTGLVVDIPFVQDFCRRHGLLLIVDAAQTAGLVPITMGQGIDVLCFTGHKALLGPQGIGGMCVAKGLAISPQKQGGSGTDSFSPSHPTIMPDALEAGTLNIPGIAGLTAGITYVQTIDPAVAQNLAEHFHKGVSAIPGVVVYSRQHLPHVPIVALNIGDMDAAEGEYILSDGYGISVRGGAHCAPLMHQALDTVKQGALRFSFSHGNTLAEVDQAIQALWDMAKGGTSWPE